MKQSKLTINTQVKKKLMNLYLVMLYFACSMSPIWKYFSSLEVAGTEVAQVPCFSHSCSLQYNNSYLSLMYYNLDTVQRHIKKELF